VLGGWGGSWVFVMGLVGGGGGVYGGMRREGWVVWGRVGIGLWWGECNMCLMR